MNKKKIKPRPFIAGSGNEVHGLSRLFSGQRFLVLIAFLFIALISWPLAKTYSQRRLVEKEISDIEARILEFEDKSRDLQELAAYLSSDQSLEEQARLNLNLKKPGEAVIIFDADRTKLVPSGAVVAAPEIDSNFRKWWLYFFG